MDAEQLQGLKPAFDSFLDRYAPPFGHGGNGGHARRFVQGLLLGGECGLDEYETRGWVG